MTNKQRTEYRIDADDRICWVSDEWLAFAERNDAPELRRETVIGASLWDFLADDSLQYLYRELVERARRTLRPRKLACRCDSSELRRLMSLEVQPLDHGEVVFAARVEQTAFPEPATLLDRARERIGPTVVLCSMCKAARLPGDRWVALEEAIDELRLLVGHPPPPISHGLCPACEPMFAEDLERG